MNQGDICLVQFPFTDGSSAKLRPVLIVSSNRFNKSEDVVVKPISSKPAKDDPFGIFIDDLIPEFKSTGLKTSSSIKWTKPMTVSKGVIRRYLGSLPALLLDETLAHLNSLFS
jgi:mRNA interferase MazF